MNNKNNKNHNQHNCFLLKNLLSLSLRVMHINTNRDTQIKWLYILNLINFIEIIITPADLKNNNNSNQHNCLLKYKSYVLASK